MKYSKRNKCLIFIVMSGAFRETQFVVDEAMVMKNGVHWMFWAVVLPRAIKPQQPSTSTRCINSAVKTNVNKRGLIDQAC